MTVIAEGVESFEELAYLLAATRIRYGQGYYFAKPFLLEEIVKTSGAHGDERVSQIGRPALYSRTLSSAPGRGRRG